jgi:hypothetical protein
LGNAVISIHQPNYLPWIGYFDKIAKSDIFVFLDTVEFSKGSFTNRNRIKLSSGTAHWLTVPVLTKDTGSPPIKDIRVNNAVNWQKKHLETIRQNYGKASFFPEVFPFLSQVMQAGAWPLLRDLNIALIKALLEQAGVSTKVYVASELDIDYGAKQKSELLLAICKHFGAGTYLSGKGARQYNDETLFKEQGVNIIYQSFQYPVYEQLYGAFLADLSVVDFMFYRGFDGLKKALMNNPIQEEPK